MKNVLMACLLTAAVACFLCGCNPCSVGALAVDTTREVAAGQDYEQNVVNSKYERLMRFNMIRDIEDRQFQDDLETIFLLEQNSRLNQWHASVRP